METLDLEVLRTLVAIDTLGSFSAAALQLGRTQSAITQQMQRLEAQIGEALFEKQGRNKGLTEHGRRLLTYARHLLTVNDEALRTLQQGQLQGLLRIGAPHDTAQTMLPPLLAEIARHAPLLQLEIHVGRSPFLMEALQRGELDIALSNRFDSALEGVVLRSSPTVWLCGAGYVHDPGKPVPLITADGPSIYRRLGHEALDAAGVAWVSRCSAPSLTGIRAALHAGLGVSPRGVEQLDAGLRVLGPVDGLPAMPDLIYRLYIRRHVVNPLTRQVFEHLKAHLRLGGGVKGG